MKIAEIYNDVINENLDYEFKAELNPENPMKWAKTIVGYANGKGGVMFVGVSNDGEAFGLTLDEIDKTKNLVARINDRNIFPHARVQYSIRSVDDKAEHFVLGIHVLQADSILRWNERKTKWFTSMVLKHIRASTELLSARSDIRRRSTSGNIRQSVYVYSFLCWER